MKTETDYHIIFEDFATKEEMFLELMSYEKSFLRDDHAFNDILLYQGKVDEITEKDASAFLKQIWLKSKVTGDSKVVYPDYKDDGTYYSDWRKSLKSLTDKEYCIVYIKLS